MCRIAGVFSKTKINLSSTVTNMCTAMKNGGPDDFGIYVDENIPLALGHRRLSIIDLSNAGHQPMLSIDSSLVLTYNGEIYNYLEIRDDLEKIGYSFKTNTDTEVIINAYLEWGSNSFEKFRGMYAFVIFDKKTQKLILVRDHAGIKPLYFYKTEDAFIFSSEIRGIKTISKDLKTNVDWPVLFLAFGFIPEPYTTLENVYQLPKGKFIEFDLQKHTLVEKSINKSTNYRKEIFDETIAKERIKNCLYESVECHLISDAPVGLFVCGGVDSSILTLIASNIKNQNIINTLSIQFDEEKYSEKKYQDIIVQQTNVNHKPFTISKEDLISSLPDIFEAMDQPSIDAINSYFICKKAKEIGLKVVISGVGADEYFGGYQSFLIYSKMRFYKFIPKIIFSIFELSPIKKFKRISYLYRKDLIGEYLFFRGIFSINEISKITNTRKKDVKEILEKIINLENPKDSFDRAQIIETELYMQNQLLRDLDCMSMWHGVEARVPFLDYNLIETIKKVDSKIKLKYSQKKYLLLETFKDILPIEIINRKKMGFTFPFEIWLKDLNKISTNNQEILKIREGFIKNKITWAKFWACEILQSKYL